MNPLTPYVLSLMMLLAPNREPKTMRPLAEAISSAAQQANEQRQVCSVFPAVTLVTTELYETSFVVNDKTTIPFGLSCCVRESNTQEHWAVVANNILAKGTRRCGYHFEKIFGYYHSGVCVADPYTTRQSATISRLLRHHR